MTIDQATYWIHPEIPVEPQTMTIMDVPCQSFWSVTVYNESGFLKRELTFA